MSAEHQEGRDSALAAWAGFSANTSHPLPFTGLSGALVWRVVDQAGRLYAFRRWPIGVCPDTVRRIHQVILLSAERTALPLPRPYSSRAGDTVHVHDRHAWDLCRWCVGEPATLSISDVSLHQGLSALASIHRCWETLAGNGPPPVQRLMRDLGWTDGPFLSPGWQRRQREWREFGQTPASGAASPHPSLSPHDPDQLRVRTGILATQWAGAIAALLRDSPPPARPTFCLRDVHRQHVLFDAHALSGIIDWGNGGVDFPAIDYGRWLGSVLDDRDARWGPALRQAAVWEGRSADELRWSWAFALVGRFLAILRWRKWLATSAMPAGLHRPAGYLRWKELVEQMERSGPPPLLPPGW